MTSQLPVVDYLVLDDEPHLRAESCTSCGALFFDRRNACARCGKQRFHPIRLSRRWSCDGLHYCPSRAPAFQRHTFLSLSSWKAVGFVKANLLGITDADQITPNLPVTLTTFSVGFDDEGAEAVAFGFRPKAGERVSAGDVWIVGASMTRFGRFEDHDLLDLASTAAIGALKDADNEYRRHGCPNDGQCL